MQRAAQNPCSKHVHLINIVLRYCKRVSTGIALKKLEPPVKLVVAADAEYKSTEDERVALRGYLVLLVGAQRSASEYPGGHCQLMDFVSRKFKTVIRSPFAVELRNQLEVAHASVYFNSFIEEHFHPGKLRTNVKQFWSVTQKFLTK